MKNDNKYDQSKYVDGGPDQAPTSTKSKTQYVRIVNEHKAPMGLPPVSKEHAKSRDITIKSDYSDRVLQPGENNVEADHWNAVKDQSPVSHWIEAGMIREGNHEDTKKPEGPSTRETIEGLSSAEAIKVINASEDRDQIVKWEAQEKRHDVRDALNRRFEALGTGK